MEKKSNSHFLDRIKNVFLSENYDYSKFVFKNTKIKVSIICPKHGEFKSLICNLDRGWGCKKCSKEKTLEVTSNKFFNLCKEVHNNFYNYEKSVYKGNNEKILINCPIHGDFLQLPRSHYYGFGCYQCAKRNFGKRRSNSKEFIEKANKVHKNIYNYDKVNYKNADIKVIIICKEHGEFEQIPRSHLSGSGCQKCNLYIGYSRSQWVNYNKGKIGTFYIIKCWNKNEQFYKIGITGSSVDKRYLNGANIPYEYEIISEVSSYDLTYIWDLEKKEKRRLKEYKYKPIKKFAGSSVECFTKF